MTKAQLQRTQKKLTDEIQQVQKTLETCIDETKKTIRDVAFVDHATQMQCIVDFEEQLSEYKKIACMCFMQSTRFDDTISYVRSQRRKNGTAMALL